MAETKLIISGEIRIDPDDFEAAVALIDPLVQATNEEAGCIAYDFWVDPRDRGRIRVFEEWESEETNAAHGASAHLATFFTAMAALRIKSVELSRFEVASKVPL